MGCLAEGGRSFNGVPEVSFLTFISIGDLAFFGLATRFFARLPYTSSTVLTFVLPSTFPSVPDRVFKPINRTRDAVECRPPGDCYGNGGEKGGGNVWKNWAH